MPASANDDTASIVYRPIEKHEEQQALELWNAVFRYGLEFFERYFDSKGSPQYQTGDTLGAWQDGKLVSAVHIRRLTIQSRDDNRQYLCGAVANVATLEDYQNRGYSRHLLQMAIDKMEQSGEFDVSFLKTGRPHHYSIFGWEEISLPSPITVDWNESNPASKNVQWRPASDVLLSDGQLLAEIHTSNPRMYQFDRSPRGMLQHWSSWACQWAGSIGYVLPTEEQGFVAINFPDNVDEVHVAEWVAPNVEIEKKLLQLAADEIRRRYPGSKTVRLHCYPQYMTLDELKKWAGAVHVGKNNDLMIRNIRLSKETYAKMKDAYTSGEAVFWPTDSF